MSFTTPGAARLAASQLTSLSPRLAALADQFETWITTQGDQVRAVEALLVAATNSNDPHRVLATADALYASAGPSGGLGVEAALAAALAAQAAAEAARDDAENHTPGTELGYAERVANSTTTATVPAATPLTGLSLSVVGTGRPVDIEFFCPAAYHSVANTLVSAVIFSNGGVASGQSQVCATSSPVTNGGRHLYMKRRVILTNGVTYNLGVAGWGGAAGTCTFVGAGSAPMFLSVTTR